MGPASLAIGLDDDLTEGNWVVRVSLSTILFAIKETSRINGLRLAFPEARFPDAQGMSFYTCDEGSGVRLQCTVEYAIPTDGPSFAGAFIRMPSGFEEMPKRTAFAYIDPNGVIAKRVAIQDEDGPPGFLKLLTFFKLLP